MIMTKIDTDRLLHRPEPRTNQVELRDLKTLCTRAAPTQLCPEEYFFRTRSWYVQGLEALRAGHVAEATAYAAMMRGALL